MDRPLEGVADRWLVYIGVGALLLIALMIARHDEPKTRAGTTPQPVQTHQALYDK
jgi:hypothetical protein